MMRLISLLFCSILMAVFAGCTANSQPAEQTPGQEKPAYTLVIHGGAGTITRDRMTPALEAAYRNSLQAALNEGEAILKSGGTSLEAVEATIRLLEDDSLFNSGRGAVLTHEGRAELDASIMDGKTQNAGAVAGVQTIKHPISAARAVMSASKHVMLSREGAEIFASEQGLELVENDYFILSRRTAQLDRILRKEQETKEKGTVGAVALDQHGNLAAGTSTGGMMNKRYGRIGDSPIIGAGTYADNQTCAVSCTGHGEYFIRYAVAYDVSAMMAYKGVSLVKAADSVILDKLLTAGGAGGLIAVDKEGNIAMPFNTSGMYRGYVTSTGKSYVGIYKDE